MIIINIHQKYRYPKPLAFPIDHPTLDSGLCVDDRWLGASRRQRQECWVFPSQSGDLTVENDDFIEFNGMLMGICADTTNKLYTMSVMSIKDGQ